MMLRSSSTPVLGSLLPSFSDSPNNNNNCHLLSEFTHKSTSKISSSSLHFHSPSASASATPFRRVQSEGNLGELADAVDELKKKNPAKLEAIPSFSSNPSSDTDDDGEESPNQVESKMYLAAGLGVSSGNGRGGGYSYGRAVGYYDREEGGGGGGRGVSRTEEHYRKMVEGDPGNGMVLRNYGEYLYRVKGDLEGAEEYYSRAILADPKDGEILSQYAKLIWELHRDENRATHYFERAIQASAGQDSHVQAAYASFLWDTEEEEEEDDTLFRGEEAAMASATA